MRAAASATALVTWLVLKGLVLLLRLSILLLRMERLLLWVWLLLLRTEGARHWIKLRWHLRVHVRESWTRAESSRNPVSCTDMSTGNVSTAKLCSARLVKASELLV